MFASWEEKGEEQTAGKITGDHTSNSNLTRRVSQTSYAKAARQFGKPLGLMTSLTGKRGQ